MAEEAWAPGRIDGEPRRRLTVIVAEDDPLARRTITEALKRANISVVAEARNGRQAVELVRMCRPDAVVMDVVMPELDGLTATWHIVSELPDQVVILLTRGGDEAMGLAGLRAGAAGFLTKDVDADALPRAVEGAVRGEAAISRRLSMRLVERLRSRGGRRHPPSPPPAAGTPLTTREWQVVEFLAEGRTTHEIAESLMLASETVRSHVKNIRRKLRVRSREELVAAAHRIRAAGSSTESAAGSVK